MQTKNNNPNGAGGFAAHPENINRNGRPKGQNTIKPLLEMIAAEQYKALDEDWSEDKGTRLEAMIRTAFDKAIQGNASARNWISDRLEGKVAEKVESYISLSEWTDDGK